MWVISHKQTAMKVRERTRCVKSTSDSPVNAVVRGTSPHMALNFMRCGGAVSLASLPVLMIQFRWKSWSFGRHQGLRLLCFMQHKIPDGENINISHTQTHTPTHRSRPDYEHDVGFILLLFFLCKQTSCAFFLIKCVNTVIKQHSGLMFLYNCYWANADAKMNNGAEHVQHSHLKFLLMIIGRATDDTREQKGSNRRGETACQNCEASSDLPLVPDHSTCSRDGF